MERKASSRGPAPGAHTDSGSKFMVRKIILDFLVLFCVGFLVLVFYLWGAPYERGFFCDDESLRHPYRESTVTNVVLYIVGLCLPVLTMCVTEFLRLRGDRGERGGRARALLGREVPGWVWAAYRAVGVFLFGCACQQLTTDVAKYTVGRLRPHFFDVCRPDVDCSLPANAWRYVETFSCSASADPRLLKEMRLSFPSGHSSFSAYTMIYFAMYLQKRFTWRGSALLRHALQLALALFAWYTVLTRVSDYKHHWSDVLAGFGVGALYAVVVFCFISDLRKTPALAPRSRPPNPDAELHVTNGNTRQSGWQV